MIILDIATANSGLGDPLRNACDYINQNFAELVTDISDINDRIDSIRDMTAHTTSEIDVLIAGNSIIPGNLYKITGFNKELYDDGTNTGTTIYVWGITTNTLSIEGYGEFFNPDYLNYDVWNNISTGTISSIVGNFPHNALIYANNGATGNLFTSIQSNKIISTSGNWATATSFIDTVGTSSANITGVSLATYPLATIVCYGGYTWTKVTSSTREPVSLIELDWEWEKNVYSDISYKKVINRIEVDYNNDMITRRIDERNNDVSWTYSDTVTSGHTYSAIQVFQFGNDDIFGNSIKNSYCEIINIKLCTFKNITMRNNANMSNIKNYGENIISGINLSDLASLSNIYISEESYISGYDMASSSSQSLISLGNSCYSVNVKFNTFSYRENVYLDYFNHENNINIGSGTVITSYNLKGYSIYNLDFDSGITTSILPTSSTFIITNDTKKNIFLSSAGDIKMKYYTNTALVITDVYA